MDYTKKKGLKANSLLLDKVLPTTLLDIFFLNPHLRICFTDFRELGTGRERDKHPCVREAWMGASSIHLRGGLNP